MTETLKGGHVGRSGLAVVGKVIQDLAVVETLSDDSTDVVAVGTGSNVLAVVAITDGPKVLLECKSGTLN